MLEQKIDVKKIFKDEYKPTKEEKEFLKQKADKNNTKPVDGQSKLSINQASNLVLPNFTYYIKLFNTNLYYKLTKFTNILKDKTVNFDL